MADRINPRGFKLLHRGTALPVLAALGLGALVPAMTAPLARLVTPPEQHLGAPAGPAPAGPASHGPAAVVVMARPGAVAGAAAGVLRLGGRVDRPLPLVGGFSAHVPAAALPALRAEAAVRSVTPDTVVRMAAGSWRAAPAQAAVLAASDSGDPSAAYPQALRADQVWRAGDTGRGVTVALIDTGVTPNLDLSGRLVSVRQGLLSGTSPCENLSGEPTCDDTYGHGTFVAGIIAGNGAASQGAHSGIAPQANILSVKVAGADGASDVSNLLAAIQWVVSYKDTYGITVLNLSLSTDSGQTYRTDPFNYAVERAWDAGITVVVSASNRGPATGTISKPGDDPLVITVGAIDDRGTAGIGDDELTDFTARGPTPADGLAKPDLVAPGAHLVSLRSPGSTIDQAFPETNDGAYHRGSGTSFSAAATSGVVALMLARTPGLTPDEVKYALSATARRLTASADPLAVGAGEVDAAAAALSPPSGRANAGVVRSNGTGLLQASRGHVEVQTTSAPHTVVNGLLTAQLVAWDPAGFLLGWSPLTWVVSTWALTPWLPVTWSADDWPGRNWGGRNWGGGDWQGSTWSGTAEPRSYGSPARGAIWFGAWG